MNLKTGVTRKQSTPNFPKNEHFLLSDTHTRFEIRPFVLSPTVKRSVSVYRMTKHTLKILHYLLQDLIIVFDHFVDNKHCRVNARKSFEMCSLIHSLALIHSLDAIACPTLLTHSFILE